MPFKKKTKGSQSSASPPVTLANAVDKLVAYLEKAWTAEGTISWVTIRVSTLYTRSHTRCRNYDDHQILANIVRSKRTKSETIDAEISQNILAALERNGKNTCGIIPAPELCLIVELVLQTDQCLASERLLYLLIVRYSANAALIHTELE